MSQPPSRSTMRFLNATATGRKAVLSAIENPDHRSGEGHLFHSTGTNLLNNSDLDSILLYTEASLALLYQFRNSITRKDLLVATCSFYHAIVGRSCVGSALRFIDSIIEDLSDDLPFFQSTTNSWIDICDALHKNVHRVMDSQLGQKLAKVFNHLIAHTFYAKVGIEIDPKLFADIEAKKIRPNVWSCLTFADAIVGLLLFLAKAGRQALLTGSIECFFIDDTVITAWLDEASVLRKDAEFLSNPKSIGITLPSYLGKLSEAIAKGEMLAKHFRGKEHSIIFNVCLELQVIQKRHMCSLLSASIRRAPVGVLVFGESSIAKTFISNGLFNHYCSVRGIGKEEAYLWTRTEGDPYYSGYKSHFAGVLYDDAGKFRVNRVVGVDPSISDIIAAINNVQFITNQADLPDKGKIPFRSEWVGVTSNVGDVNADMYFNCSGAFMRRFSVRIVPTVKPGFCLEGSKMIDTKKIPPGEQYPDLWTFQVDKPTIREDGSGEFAPWKTGLNYAQLLVVMTGVYQKHIAQQDKFMDTAGKIGPEELCDCRLPKSICQCGNVDGLVLNASPDIVAQARLLRKKIPERISKLYDVRRRMKKKYPGPSETLMLVELEGEAEVMKWFDPDFSDPDISDDEAVKLVEEHLDLALSQYTKLTPREKLDELTDGTFSNVDSDEAYLTFEPEVSGPGFFLESHLAQIRKVVLTFTPGLTKSERALMDVYIYEKAPNHISKGWCMRDIVRAALDYIKFYSDVVENPDIVQTREYLLNDRASVGFVQRTGVWLAGCYFANERFHNVCNWLFAIPGVTGVVAACANFCLRNNRRHILERAGRSYDNSLMGSHPYVKVLLGALAFAGIAAVMIKLVSVVYKRKEPKHDEEDEASAPVTQMDLESVGRKPTVRPMERSNVWLTENRSITKFDVDPRRPHNFEQCVASLKNNVVYCTIKGNFPAGAGEANNRALMVDSKTMVINEHSLPEGGELRVWCGPRTAEGVQPSIVFKVDELTVSRFKDRDLAIVSSMSFPHVFKDIKHLLVKRSFASVGECVYVTKGVDGELGTIDGCGLRLDRLDGMAGAPHVSCDAWAMHPERPTKLGECGSPLVVNSPLGSVVLGFHCGYIEATNKCFATPIYSEDFWEECVPGPSRIGTSAVVAQVAVYTQLKVTDKLFTDYHDDGHMMVHGQIRGFIPRPKFTGTYTPHARYVLSRGGEFSPPITDNMARPINCGWKQPQMILENYLHPTHSMTESVLVACMQVYCEHIDANLTGEDWEDIHPVPITVAVNGFPGVPNVDAQKFTTSAGHGHRGSKLQFLSDPEDYEEWASFRKYSQVITEEVEEIRENAAQGIRPHAVYDACMKDEMLSKEKVAAGKARAIYMCPVAFLTNMRMSVMAMCRVMVRRKHVFGMAIGLNTHSEEWDELHKNSQRLPGSNWVAGDFKAFESVLSILVLNVTSQVFIHMAKRSGNYDSEELMVLETLLADISNPTINFFGQLITLLGGEASGHQLTTPVNCVANNLLHMYAYVKMSTLEGSSMDVYKNAARSFMDNVYIMTLGDDVFLKVHPQAALYNHTSIQAEFEKIGITYTMADKNSPSVPYISLEEVTFLKRSFVDHQAFPGIKVAALSKLSIYKMLLYTIPSKTASPEEQFTAACASAQAEAFFHGRKFFNQIRDLVEDLPKSRELEYRVLQHPPPTWRQMVLRFTNASPKLKANTNEPGIDAESFCPKDSDCASHVPVLQMDVRMDAWGSTTMGRSPEDRIYGEERLCLNKTPTGYEFEEALDPDNTLLSKSTKTQKTNTTTATRDMAPVVVEKAISKLHNKNRRRKRSNDWLVVAQSDITTDPAMVGAPSQDEVHQTTAFMHEPPGESLDMSADSNSFASALNMEQDIGKYLSRPRKVATYVWAENGSNGIKADYDIWSLFFTDVNMAAKLRGYSMLRANLHVKFLINGSPFYYGSMMASYTPMSGHRTDSARVSSSSSLLLVAESQKPHVWLENQNMSTADMTLPFLYPYPYLDIGNIEDLEDMGRVSLIQYVPLKSANGSGTGNITITVYAWAEDVMVSGPTDLPIMQMEFKPNGQVSKAASAVAAASGALSKIPIIGEYAMATEMAAKSVGKFASYFGFTNVPNVRDVEGVKQVPFQLASTEISEPLSKLSLQAKQETAIGASQHGGGNEDELVITRLAGRTSFLVGSLWSTADSQGTPLFTTMVNPAMFRSVDPFIAHTPVSYFSNMFQYWRGSLKYTFKVVRSPYHRGRVQISWDRAAIQLSLGPPIGNPNTYTVIMDLDSDDEVSFVVPYMQPTHFLETYDVVGPGTELYSTTATPTGSWPYNNNGVLSVRVLNSLTAPEPSSDVTMLVFVSACDDLELAGPRSHGRSAPGGRPTLSPQLLATPQSNITYNDTSDSHSFNGAWTPSPLYKEVFGEKITSMREMLHRSSKSFEWVFLNSAFDGAIVNTIPLKRMPPPSGCYNNGWVTATVGGVAGQSYMPTYLHPITLVSACFIGYKGSVNVTANINQGTTLNYVDSFYITRSARGSSLGDSTRRPGSVSKYQTSSTAASRQLSILSATEAGVEGRALTNTRTNAGLAANLPYYSKSGFQISNPSTEYNNQDVITDANNDWWFLTYEMQTDATQPQTDASTVAVYYGTGPDFDLVYFINVPLMRVTTVS